MTDLPALVARAKTDPAMLRDYGRAGAAALTDAELGAALGHGGAGARHAVTRLAADAPRSGPARLVLLALLDGWRPARSADA